MHVNKVTLNSFGKSLERYKIKKKTFYTSANTSYVFKNVSTQINLCFL